MTDCIFCSIVKGDIPSNRLYEDENYIAFLDIFPRVYGHTLIIPKVHYRWVYDVPDFPGFWRVTKIVALRLKDALQAFSVSFVTLGDEVPHAHIHILPQKDQAVSGFHLDKPLSYTNEELQNLITKFKTTI